MVVVEPKAQTTSKLTIGGRLQIQYAGLSTDNVNSTGPSRVSHFFVRRAYLAIKASMGTDKLLDITYDLASNSFDSAFFRWKQSAALVFDVGLRKVNFAYEESFISSGALKSIERSGATRFFVEPENTHRLGAGSYRLGLYADGTKGAFFWGVALTNPERVTSATAIGTAASNGFSYWGNLGIRSKLKSGFYVLGAGVGLLPDQGGKTPGTGNDLLVGNLYLDLTLGRLSLLSEYLLSRNEEGAVAGLDAHSYTWWFQPSYKFDQHWEAVARFSYVDTDGRGINLSDGIRSAPSGGTMDKLSDFYLGFTYYFSGNDLKFQTGYIYGKAWDTIVGDPANATAHGVRSQLQVQF